MRHRVRVPDGTVVEVEAPESATPDEITAFAAQSYQAQPATPATAPASGAPSVVADAAKAAAYSLPKAGAAMAGMAGDVRDLARAGREKLLSYLPDSVRAADSVVPRVFNPLGAIAPTSQSIRRGVESVTGPWYDPQTRTGKVVDTGVQTAATLGKNWLVAPKTAAAITAGTTAGTEAAGALSDDNPWMRLGGGLLGGFLPALGNAMKSRAGVIVKDAIGNPSDQDITLATLMQGRGRQEGIPLLGTESFGRGGQLASAVLAHPASNAGIEAFLGKRPEQVRQAVGRVVQAPIGNHGTPSDNAQRAEQAATDVIRNAERARSAAVRPYYDAAQYETVPPQSLRPVANEIQSLMFKSPIGDPADRALAGWYGQMFPTPMEAPPAAPGRVLGKARGPGSVDVNKDDLVTAIRKLGGINPQTDVTTALAQGNPFGPHPSFGPVWRKPAYGTSASNKTVVGHNIDDMAGKLYEHGYIPEPDLNYVMDAIADASLGRPTFSRYRDAPVSDPLTLAIDRLTQQLEAKRAPREAPPAAPEGMLPETNVGRLTQTYQNLGFDRNLPTVGATSEQKAAAFPAGKVQDVLGDVLRQHNPNFRKGNEVYEAITRNRVEPLTAGPVGVVAGKTGFDPAAPSNVPRILSTVADQNVARPDTIRRLYTELNAQDKAAFPGIAQTYIENELNAALKDLTVGPSYAAGAKFRNALFGDKQKRENFNEVMRGVAAARGKDADTVLRGVTNLFSVLERTGRTPGIGSQTQPRQEIAREATKSAIGDVLQVASANPSGGFVRRLNDRLTRATYTELGRALTAENSVDMLVKLAKIRPNSLTARYYVAVMLGLDDANAGGP